MDAVVAGSAAFPAAAPGKFWPEPVAVLLADAPGPPTPPAGAMPPFTPPRHAAAWHLHPAEPRMR